MHAEIFKGAFKDKFRTYEIICAPAGDDHILRSLDRVVDVFKKDAVRVNNTGDICIAVNPYRWLAELYRDDTRDAYTGALATLAAAACKLVLTLIP